MSDRASIAIVEDQPATSLLWARVVRRAGWRCAGRFADAATAWQVLRVLPPDLVLLDWELPGSHGGWLAERLRAVHPAVRILVVTGHDEASVLREALGIRVHGFVRKPAAPAELEGHIREVLAGHMPLATRHGAAVLAPLPFATGSPASLLSPREREIVLLGARGCSVKEMAELLGLAASTIPTYKDRIVRKLGARNFTEAVAIAAGFSNWHNLGPSPGGSSGREPRAGA